MTVIILISVLLIIALSVALKMLITLRESLATLEKSLTSLLKDSKKKVDDGTIEQMDEETIRRRHIEEMIHQNNMYHIELTKNAISNFL